MISGIVVMGLGGLAMGAGAFLSTLSYLACRNLPPLAEQESCLPTPWLIMLGAGAGTALVIGMPMTIAGSRNVPRDDQHAAPSLIITPGAAMLRWRF